jgi:branched-chain amino acid transport system permease protein
MRLLTETVTLGVLIGGIYALVAAGLSLIFGVLRVVNFAHGEMGMIGAFAGYYAGASLGFPPIATVVVAAAAGGAVGYATNALLLRPIYLGRIERPGEYALIVTFALSMLLVASATAVFGPTFRRAESFWDYQIRLGDWLHVAGDRVVAFGGSLVLLGVLFWLIYRTDVGRAWRALTQNRLGAQLVGIDAARLANSAFGVGAGLTAAAAALLAPLYFVYPTSGVLILVKAFVVVIIGGLGSIWGVLLGGLMLGLVETLGSTYISSAYRDAYGFMIMIAILLIWPHGVFGRDLRAL